MKIFDRQPCRPIVDMHPRNPYERTDKQLESDSEKLE